jgi:D-glycero-D-manno-heptose 1,7-bisphosphate phosphatase
LVGDLKPAVFLDRDGTIIEDRNYLGDPEGVALLPGAAEAIGKLNSAGIPVIVVTNQSGIGRGYFGEAEYRAVTDRIETVLQERGARLDACYHCPHSPDLRPPCECRKPQPGLFRKAAEDHAIDLARSFYVGDRLRDLEPGLEKGGRGYLLVAPGEADTVELPAGVAAVSSLGEAVRRVLAELHFD